MSMLCQCSVNVSFKTLYAQIGLGFRRVKTPGCAIIRLMKLLTPKLRRTTAIVVGVIVLLLIGLALDLRFHGLAWRVFYSVTGEETPANQLYDFVQYLGNLTRRQPVTASNVPIKYPIKYTDMNPVGANTFLVPNAKPP